MDISDYYSPFLDLTRRDESLLYTLHQVGSWVDFLLESPLASIISASQIPSEGREGFVVGVRDVLVLPRQDNPSHSTGTAQVPRIARLHAGLVPCHLRARGTHKFDPVGVGVDTGVTRGV